MKSKRVIEAASARTAKAQPRRAPANGSVRYPDGPGMWLWSEHSDPVEVWILGWWDDTPEEAKDWSLDDLRFEIDGRRYVPAELGGNWKRVQAQNAALCHPAEDAGGVHGNQSKNL